MLRIETRSLADLGRGVLAAVGLCTITVSGIVIAVDSAARRSVIVPLGQRGYGFPPWLAGPLHDLGGTRLTAPQYGLWVLLMAAGYLLVVANSRFLRTVPTLATIGLLQVVFMLTPPLGSTDATNYIAYARLGALSGLSPYSHTPADAPWDPSFTWATWPHYSSPYGPLFTLIAYAFAPLGLAATGWAFKVLFTAASAGCLALVWRCARLLGRPPLAAVAFVGLSPAWLIWSVGGAHNDSLMELLVLLAIFMSLTSRETVSGVAAVAAVAIKAPAVLLLPFLAIAGRRRPLLIGSAAAAAAVMLATVLAFGSLEPFTAFRHQASFASTKSVIGQFTVVFGGSRILPSLWAFAGPTLLVAVGIAAGWALRTRRWLPAYGWAVAALIVILLWEFPWYLVWLLPIAALVPQPRLRVVTVALGLLLLWAHTPHATVSAWFHGKPQPPRCTPAQAKPCPEVSRSPAALGQVPPAR